MDFDINNNATINHVASALLYARDLSTISAHGSDENRALIAQRAAQTVAIVDNRIDALIAHLSDESAEEVLVEALRRSFALERERAARTKRRKWARIWAHRRANDERDRALMLI